MPSASLWYSGDYEIFLTEKELLELGHSYFTTHQNQLARWIHLTSQFFLWPFRKSLQFTARALQPRPGENKDDEFITQTAMFRIVRMSAGILFLAISALIAAITFPVHLSALVIYKLRPAIGYIRPDVITPIPCQEKNTPLIICSYNVALMLSTICIANDTRTPEERAVEIAEDILDNKDQYSPDVLCFQEAFHQDATQILIEKLKEKYPYIVYNVAPTAIGLGSGLMIASKYPIKAAHFTCFKDSTGEDRLAPKGALSGTIEINDKQLCIYNAHLQAMPGREEARVRLQQMLQIEKVMKKDKKANPQLEQIMLGDLNVSKFSEWDVSNEDPNQPDKAVLDHMAEQYNEPFYEDHDATGQRLPNTEPYFQKEDEHRVGKLSEPSSTTLLGAHATPNNPISAMILTGLEKKQSTEHFHIFSQDALKKLTEWGTQKWQPLRPVTKALLDHILIPKTSSITAQVEIRNTKLSKEKQSGSSDHLPIYGRIFYTKTKSSLEPAASQDVKKETDLCFI